MKSGLAQLVGYLPQRGDFDIEYDNDAELMLADMEFKPEDTKQERELKVKVLQIYNSKLDARAERKRFIVERGLLEHREKKRTKEERQIEESMRVFARFHSKEEHEAFVEGLINEMRLRNRIQQLQTWRLAGCRTLAEGAAYEAERKRQEQAKGTGQPADATAAPASLKGSRKRAGAASTAASESKKKKAGGAEEKRGPLDISAMDGYELLSANERKVLALAAAAQVAVVAQLSPRVRSCARSCALSRATTSR